jgi:hypothetical protein
MNEILLPALGVFVLGITTTMHPCPLATNIAAISLISGVSSGRKRHLGAVVGFGAGYVSAFTAIALVVSLSLVAVPTLSLMLQRIVAVFLGQLLILAGMVLARIVDLNRFYKGISLSKSFWLTNGTFISSMLPGALLAFSFCPATASIFFGVMIPLSVKHGLPILFPILYALGALFPVIAASVVVRRGMGRVLSKRYSRYFSQISGWTLILIGLYITLKEVYL